MSLFTKRNVAAASAGAAMLMALPLVSKYEGLRPVAYRDAVGVPTVCYGETAGVKMGDKYTVEQCKQMLLASLPKYAKQIEPCIKPQIPDSMRAALISFAYNLGPGWVCKGSIRRNLDAGNLKGACDAMLAFDTARDRRTGERVRLRGLTIRRNEERALCRADL